MTTNAAGPAPVPRCEVPGARRVIERALRAARGFLGGRRSFAALALKHGWSPLLPPWRRLRRDRSITAMLRRLALREVWESIERMPDRLLMVHLAAAWPVTARVQVLTNIVRFGSSVKRDFGVALFDQYRAGVRTAVAFDMLPSNYYTYRLWLPGYRLADVIPDFELSWLNMRLASLNRNDIRLLDDKLAFDEACRASGLPVPPIVASFHADGRECWRVGPPGHLPRESAFLKPVDGKGGQGAERWTYRDQAWTRSGVTLDEAGLIARCRNRARTRSIVLQRALSNGPELARYSTAALCTFRIVTMRDPDRPAELVGTVLRMPDGHPDVDNLSAGGIAAAIDLSTGRLRPAVRGRPVPDLTHHPATGSPIAGTALTCVEAATRLACEAHERLPMPWSVGWDVAVTPDGPVLVEGNSRWASEIMQWTEGRGLGSSPFVERLLERLEAAERPAGRRLVTSLTPPSGG